MLSGLFIQRQAERTDQWHVCDGDELAAVIWCTDGWKGEEPRIITLIREKLEAEPPTQESGQIGEPRMSDIKIKGFGEVCREGLRPIEVTFPGKGPGEIQFPPSIVSSIDPNAQTITLFVLGVTIGVVRIGVDVASVSHWTVAHVERNRLVTALRDVLQADPDARGNAVRQGAIDLLRELGERE